MSRHNKKMKCKEMRLARNVLSLCHHFSVDFQEKWDDIEAHTHRRKKMKQNVRKKAINVRQKNITKKMNMWKGVYAVSHFFSYLIFGSRISMIPSSALTAAALWSHVK